MDPLNDLGGKLQAAVADGEPLTYSSRSRDLHRTILELSQQPVATELLDRLEGQSARHQQRVALRAGRPQVSLRGDLAIIGAVCRRDPAAAEEAVRAHLRSVIIGLSQTDA
ncbi:FCD domain-containing protein [Blastococcus sp. CT_GayMR16]|uniref:FCD domain-containing protein n=1 Tax=Blastococcus sp. CT_GayMR16 TaxID=2559607 RepID=UPI001ADDC2E8|nr:FCD domain-containing protein [Blastococcus sp. CT_GayMR16]